MKKLFFASIFVLLGCSSKKAERYVPDSNGNLNHVTVVMSNAQWNGGLGELVRKEIASEYEGLPMNEPRFSLKQLHPKTLMVLPEIVEISFGLKKTVSLASS